MGFPFVYVCDLLEDLQKLHLKNKPLLENDIEQQTRSKIKEWFDNHRNAIKEADGVAILSALLPELRTDKVLNIRENRLQGIIGRSAGLGIERIKDLARWTKAGHGDLADCTERVLKPYDLDLAGRIDSKAVSVEEIEQATMAIASRCRYSAPSVTTLKRENSSQDDCNELIMRIYRRVKSREAKWLTRLILKSYLPIKVADSTVYWSYHPRLPPFLKVQAQFSHAIGLLREFEEHGGSDVLKFLRPHIGVKVGRQKFHQARSIYHCMKMGGERSMIVERKYDGEYLQLHIDISKPRRQRIQIFSKSGKDSTWDRYKIHDTIEKCLKLDETTCKIAEKCILEGELLVFSDKDKTILPFDKIRKHVNRSGSFIGTDGDSQAHPYENLCIMFFDIMLLDNIPLLNIKHSERQKYLQSILQIIPGRAEIVERTTIDFSTASAADDLCRVFAKCITRNEEGLVVKPDEPYLDLSGDYGGFKSCCIKMKQDAMGNMGSGVGDFAVVGANYRAADANKFVNLSPPVKWTEFCLGCLTNREDVLRYNAKPSFVIVKTVSLNRAMMKDFMNNASRGNAVPFDQAQVFVMTTPRGIANGQPPQTVFKKPFVFDLKSFQFEREGNTGFDSPRFPQVTKIHYDREFMDCLTFQELQAMGKEASTMPLDFEDHKTEREWMRKLMEANPKHSRNILEYVEMVERSTQATTEATTQGSTQDTTSTKASDTARESHRRDIHAASTQAFTAVQTSVSESNVAFHLSHPQTGRVGHQAEELSSTAKSAINLTHSRKEMEIRGRVSSSRDYSRALRPSDPPAQFLEKHELARAAEEQDYEEIFGYVEDGVENSENLAALVQKEAQVARIYDSASARSRKRCLEGTERSPEVLTKRQRQLSTSSNSTNTSSASRTSNFRKVLSDITNASPPRKLSVQIESSSKCLQKRDAEPSILYPTLPEEQPDVTILSRAYDSESHNKAFNTHHAKIASPVKSRRLHWPTKTVTSEYNSSSRNSKSTETPRSSPPSLHSFESYIPAAPPQLFLPSSTSLMCVSPSSATTPCLFARYTFYLAPDIAYMPYITETLLPPHNRSFTTSLTQWADPSLFPTHFPSSHPTFPRKRMLRCVLVESRRTEATGNVILELKKWVRDSGFKRGNGEREPVVVVDWRILEKMVRIEGNPEENVMEGEKVWRRFSMYGGFI